MYFKSRIFLLRTMNIPGCQVNYKLARLQLSGQAINLPG